MSVNKYIEIDSTFRNRNQYPYPADFTVEIAQSGQKNALTAEDPVCDASPILVWNNSFIESPWGSNVITNITISPNTTPGTQGNTVFQATSPTGSQQQFRQINGFYNGASIWTSSSGTAGFPSPPPITARRIINYEYINLNNALITVDSAIPDSFVGVYGIWQITNPTPIPTNTANSVINFYIPNSIGSDNYYINYYIQNMMTYESRLITAYDGTTHLATLNSPTVNTDWMNIPSGGGRTGSTANFVIRRILPAATGVINNVSPNNLSVQLNSLASNIGGLYSGSFLRIVQTNYTGPNSTGPYSSPLPPYTEEARIANYIAGDGTITAVSGNTVTLNPTTSSSTDNYYVGGILTDTSKSSTGAVVTNYVGLTHIATLYSPIGAAVGDNWTMRTAVLQSPGFSLSPYLSMTGLLNQPYEVEMFTRDNTVPFNYIGSIVSSSEMVCYEIELLNLTLPNTTLNSGHGGRAIFYPYLYVELQQVSAASAGNKGIIYSNNPHSNKMLFRAIVDDTTSISTSPFIRIDGDGMTHTIKFKPNDSFHFSVRHPSTGELFQTVIQDNYSPTEPNPLVQITACFAFKRKE